MGESGNTQEVSVEEMSEILNPLWTWVGSAERRHPKGACAYAIPRITAGAGAKRRRRQVAADEAGPVGASRWGDPRDHRFPPAAMRGSTREVNAHVMSPTTTSDVACAVLGPKILLDPVKGLSPAGTSTIRPFLTRAARRTSGRRSARAPNRDTRVPRPARLGRRHRLQITVPSVGEPAARKTATRTPACVGAPLLCGVS